MMHCAPCFELSIRGRQIYLHSMQHRVPFKFAIGGIVADLIGTVFIRLCSIKAVFSLHQIRNEAKSNSRRSA